MEPTIIIIAILLAIVLTNVLDSVVDSLPLPLIELAAGCLLGFTALETSLTLDPEIFMAMVIAPLLFRESEESELMSLWNVKKQVFLMAFLLVFITVAGIGVAAHLLIPSLPLAACFALGAVLGPTDYVAVASLSSKVKLPDMLITVLKGEALINDASGLISLRFATAALLTGVFSIFDASLKLLILSVGGFLVGQILNMMKRLITESLRKMMIHYTDTYLLLELMLPVVSYVVAELCGVSGILAAVTSGALQALDFKRHGMFEAELGIAKQTMWDIVSFVLNSLVFIMLGMQLPRVVGDIWNNVEYDHIYLMGITFLVTLIMMSIRFFSLMFLANEVIGNSIKEKLKNTVILTLAGVKGVVAMAAAILLPTTLGNGDVFKERPLLMFISAGAIVLSLVLALFLLPLIVSNTPTKDPMHKPQLDLLREVVRQLKKKEGEHLGAVIVGYQRRIRDLEHAGYKKQEMKRLKAIWDYAGMLEMAALNAKKKKKSISPRLYRDYREIMGSMRRFESRGALTFTMAGIRRTVGRLLSAKKDSARLSVEEYRQKLRDLFWDLTDMVVESLEEVQYRFSDELIAQFVEERINFMGQLIDDAYAGTIRDRLQQEYIDELLVGFEIERETIWDFLDEGRISDEQANELRVNVNKLETFTLSGNRNDTMVKLMSLAEARLKERSDSAK